MRRNSRVWSLNLFSNIQLIHSLISLPLPAAFCMHFCRVSTRPLTLFSPYLKMSLVSRKLPELMDSVAWRCLQDLLGHGAKKAVWAMTAGSCTP